MAEALLAAPESREIRVFLSSWLLLLAVLAGAAARANPVAYGHLADCDPLVFGGISRLGARHSAWQCRICSEGASRYEARYVQGGPHHLPATVPLMSEAWQQSAAGLAVARAYS